MVVEDATVRQGLLSAIERATRVIRGAREKRSPLGEQNTKSALIEPVLEALGWDVRDPEEVFREYSQPPASGRVDYALLVDGEPSLFVEAKDLNTDLADRKWLDQFLRYAWMTRVAFCLLTNGDDYHLYAVRESPSQDDEVVATARVSDTANLSATVAMLQFVSKDSVRAGNLRQCLRSWRVDRRVESELLKLLEPGNSALPNLIRRQMRDLSLADVRGALGRARLRVEFPAGPVSPPTVLAAAAPSLEGQATAVADAAGPEPTASVDWGVRAFRPPLQIEVGTDVLLLTKWRAFRQEVVAQRVSMEMVLRTAQSACALAQRGEDVCVPAIRRETTGPSSLNAALRGVAALLLSEAIAFARASAHAEYFSVPAGSTPEGMTERVRRAAQGVEPSRPAPPQHQDEADGHQVRRRFWTQLLAQAAAATRLHAGRTPGNDSWLGAGAGRAGLTFCYVVREHDAHVELYIDRGKGNDAWNKRVFDQLIGSRQSVEAAFGGPLEWQPLEGKCACRIRCVLPIGGYRDESKWPEVHKAMVDAMVRLETALRPGIAALSL
jgi:hypothetical protein